jgi:CDP-diacylglycerol--serine O-phosphatidyltransferase
LLTIGNAMCGFAAIAAVCRCSETDPSAALLAAACLIYVAMVFDTFDGLAARLMKQTSPFGAQLDSLCDVISFGVAPAILMVQFSLRYNHSPQLLWPVAALYVVCTVLRLARFNVGAGGDDHPKKFCGLPSPAAAGTVASFPLLVSKPRETAALTTPWERIGAWLDGTVAGWLPLVTVIVACLMVSRIRYAHINRHLAAGRRSRWYPVRLTVAIATILLLPQAAAALLFGWYTFVTPFRGRQRA